LFFVFLIPWALFLFYWLLVPKALNPDRDVRLIYGFICYSLSEALLFMFFMFAAFLPFLPNYSREIPKSPPSAFIPHGLLAVILAGVVILAVRNIVFRLREKKGGRKAEALKGES
jgi:TRAP-type C4-dicarboxylate transport system permease small subunit